MNIMMPTTTTTTNTNSSTSSSSPSSNSSTVGPETYLLSRQQNNRSMQQQQQQQKSKMHLFLKQTYILIWKSWIIRRIHYISTFFEIISPILVIFLFAYVYSVIPKFNDDNINNITDNTYGKIPAQHFRNPYLPINFNVILSNVTNKIYYTPNDIDTRHILNSLIKSSENTKYFQENNLNKSIIKLIPMDNVYDIKKQIQLDLKNNSIGGNLNFMMEQYIFGLNFKEINTKNGLMNYDILFPISSISKNDLNVYPKKSVQGPTNDFKNLWQLPIIYLTSYINREFLRQYSNNSIELSDINLMRMPYPAHRDSKNLQFSVFDLLPLIILISYTVFVPLIVKRITDEKSNKSKELLRMIGTNDTVFWLSHLLNFLIVIAIHGLFFSIALICFANPIIIHSSLFLFFIVFILFGIQTIMYAMLITTVFNRPILAVIFMTVTWLLLTSIIFRGYLPSFNENTIGNNYFTIRFFLSMLPMGSLFWFISIMGTFEQFDQSLSFKTINQATIEFGNLTILVVIIAVLISYFLYAFLIWYMDNVWPFQYGVPKKPWFIFDSKYWFPKRTEHSLDEQPEFDRQAFEPDPSGLTTAIEIRNITKKFAGNKIAVDNLWLNIYNKQLTVLLGHNGAGKSTTMNMITGIFPSTSGNIYVNGYDIVTQTLMARQSIGLCTQENILFQELTVYQHLKLFAILKNSNFSNVNQEVLRVIKMIQLSDKCNVRASNLSGGMKRKLQLGMAIIGNTEIIILDEPTSGLDPEARRVIWDLLISLRREKTILLTTHYMEEADVLGDRIAIMSEGKLRCCGAPFFLKNAFGTGYQLRIEKNVDRFDSNRFLSHICRYISGTTLKSEIETEVIYSLNKKLDNCNNNNNDNDNKKQLMQQLPLLFRDMEKNRKEFGIKSFGLSYSTLEDVFLAVENDDNIFESKLSNKLKKLNNDNMNGNEQHHQQQQRQLRFTEKSEMVNGCTLIMNQFVALFLKRFHYARRYWQMLLLQLIIPLIIFIIAMRLSSFFSNIANVEDIDDILLETEHLYGTETKSYYQGAGGGDQTKNFYESYKYIAEQDKSSVTFIGDQSDYEDVILKQNDNIGDYVQKVLYGLQIRPSSSFNVWFNNEQTYSALLSIKTFFNTYIDMITADHLKSNTGIKMTLMPVVIQNENPENIQITSLLISWVTSCLILLPIAFPFLAASYTLYPIKERTSKSKLLQMMGGVSPTVFWLSHFIFDIIYHLFTISILYLFIYLFDTDKVFFDTNSKSSANVLFVILFVFGIGTIPLGYFFSYIFNFPSSGFTFVLIIFLVMGLFANIFYSILDLTVNNLGVDLSANNLQWTQTILPIVRSVPIFSMLFGYQKLFKANLFVKFCKSLYEKRKEQFCNDKDNPMGKMFNGCCPEICTKDNSCYDSGSFSFSKFGSGPEIYSLLGFGLVYMLLLILYENFNQYARKYLIGSIQSIFGRISKSIRAKPAPMILNDDSDVLQEKERIESIMADPIQRNNSDLLIVHQLTKIFGSFTAVNKLSFGVRHDECFGLLGVNGAGKTTTFSMLTGDTFPSDGNAYINGRINLLNDLSEFQQNIGYCPQFDALLDLLTGRETLRMMGTLRGIPWNRLSNDVNELINMVDLQKHANKLTKVYSGGNKRKLSIALALIGNPKLLFLDEPTCGVDPSARRKIWRTLGQIRNQFNSVIVLTSHSMEECEALCTRIAIMVNGRFECLGSTQHLRAKYGQGYTILIRLNRDNDENYVEHCKEKIIEAIPSSKLSDHHQCLMTYHVSDKSICWSELFELMARLNEQLQFEDYIISDTTLESIFILFARNQQRNQQNSS